MNSQNALRKPILRIDNNATLVEVVTKASNVPKPANLRTLSDSIGYSPQIGSRSSRNDWNRELPSLFEAGCLRVLNFNSGNFFQLTSKSLSKSLESRLTRGDGRVYLTAVAVMSFDNQPTSLGCQSKTDLSKLKTFVSTELDLRFANLTTVKRTDVLSSGGK